VEKLGGLAGIGLPGARIRSRGQIEASKLTASERTILDGLFERPPAAPAQARDAFRYRLTRQTDKGLQTVEVHEDAVPEALRACVVDELA
jgi:hypothetical protein